MCLTIVERGWEEFICPSHFVREIHIYVLIFIVVAYYANMMFLSWNENEISVDTFCKCNIMVWIYYRFATHPIDMQVASNTISLDSQKCVLFTAISFIDADLLQVE